MEELFARDEGLHPVPLLFLLLKSCMECLETAEVEMVHTSFFSKSDLR